MKKLTLAAAAILLAASVWRDASRRLDHALAILDDPDKETPHA